MSDQKYDVEYMFKFEVEQNRKQMHNVMDEAIERIKERKEIIDIQYDALLDKHQLVIQINEDRRKKLLAILQQTDYEQIEACRRSVQFLKEPAMLKFECEKNVIFSQIDQMGKLVEKMSCDRDDNDFNQFDYGNRNPLSEVQRTPREISPAHPYYRASVAPKVSQNFKSSFQTHDEIHFTDDPRDIFYNDFSICSPHSLYIDGKYWDSVNHYFQAHESKYQTAQTENELLIYWNEIILKALSVRYRNQSAVLLCTSGKQIIYEHNHEYWGNGRDGNGQNRLGALLMSIRDRRLDVLSRD